MILFLPTRGTPYDLRFSLFGIPVTVSPFFWVVAPLLAFWWLYEEPGGPANLIAWVLCVFVSILLHEFGHALTMRAFGHEPEVVLHHFGGYATYRGRETPGRSFLISAAGPAVQLALFAILVAVSFWLLRDMVDWSRLRSPLVLLSLHGALANALADAGFFEAGTPLYAIVYSLLFINLYWPLLNLLPVLPLDGGRMLHSLLELFDVRSASNWAVKVGVFVGAIAAAWFLIQSNFIMGAMFAFMAMENYQTLKGERFGAR